MAILDALGAYLVTNSLGTLATDIFLARMPDSPDACITIYESKGASPQQVFGTSVYGVDRPRIRVLVRGTRNNYAATRAIAVSVRNVLGAVRNTTISSVPILTIMASSEVYPLGRDAEDRVVFGCDYTVWLP